MISTANMVGGILLAVLFFCGAANASAATDSLKQSGKIHIEVYGDSTIEGWDGQQLAKMPAPAVMSNIIGSVNVKNMGVSGTTVDQYLATWMNLMDNSQATIVIVNWGLNDAIQCDAGRFEKNMRWIVAHTPMTLILETPNYVMRSPLVSARRQQCVSQFAEIVRHIAADTRVPLIDIYRFTEVHVKKNPALLPDGMHPSQTLYTMIGQYMAKTITNSMNLPKK